MTDNRTTELLRKLLDERGVEYETDDGRFAKVTKWLALNGRLAVFAEYDSGELTFAMDSLSLTPEQAIAATLGRPTFNANLEQALSFMRIWISDDAHLGESELSAAFEKAEGLRKLDAIESAIAATLGSERETELQDSLNEVADKWARAQVEAEDYAKENLLLRAKLDAATHGTLTAEQVMAIAAKHQPDYCSDTHVCFDWQAIADELNAALGRPKAKAHPYGYEPDTGAFDCTRCECGCINDISATYCNDCGGEIEIDMYAEKEIYHCPRHLVFAEKHDDGSLEFDGKRYIAATLGSGTLTAEQVEKAIHDCSTYASYDGCTYYASGIRLQAIADELNAEQVKAVER